jgi:hypothetical protein
MAGKPQLKNELIEFAMEGKALCENFAADTVPILASIDKNEEVDHKNDIERQRGISFLLDALKSCSAKNIDEAEKFVHCALQKFQEQERLDYADDKPRIDAKIKISIAREKSINNAEAFTRLLERLNKK